MDTNGSIKTSHWFEYFPDHYMWSQAMALAFGLAAWRATEFGDVDRAGRRLKHHLGDDAAWYREWRAIAEEAEGRANEAESRGRRVTAGDAFFRAATYYSLAERFLSHINPDKLDTYRRSIACFGNGAAIAMPRLEKAEVPYEDTYLSAYFLPPEAEPLIPRLSSSTASTSARKLLGTSPVSSPAVV